MNIVQYEDNMSPPVKENGELYEYMVLYQESLVQGESLTELMEFFVPGYSELDESQRYLKRLMFVTEAQVVLQARLLATVDIDELCTPEEKEILEAPRDAPLRITEWNCLAPLVLIADFYQPHGKLPVPTSTLPDTHGIIWLSAITEKSFFNTLHYAEMLQLFTSVDV